MKTCTRCKTSKELTEFSRRGRGYQSKCKQCNHEYRQEWYAKNKKEYIERIMAKRKNIVDMPASDTEPVIVEKPTIDIFDKMREIMANAKPETIQEAIPEPIINEEPVIHSSNPRFNRLRSLR